LNIVFGFQQRYGQGYQKAPRHVAEGGIVKLQMAHAQGAYSQTPLPTTRNVDAKMRQWTVWRYWFGDLVLESYCYAFRPYSLWRRCALKIF
jgi:hypothetical protein